MQISDETNARTGLKYLITGATGNIGSLVVKRLIERGDRLGVFVREAARAQDLYGSQVEIAVGDLADPASLELALRNIDTLFLVNAGPDLALRDEISAQTAHAAGVQRVVKLSTKDVEQNVGTGIWHAKGESAIRATGVRFVFVRPSGFMTNALAWATSIKEEGIVRSATGEGKIAFIHPADIAEVAVTALVNPEYDGQSLSITGPEPLSYSEMTAKIGQVIGRRLRFEPIAEKESRKQLSAAGEQPASVDYHLSIFRAIREGRLASVTDTIQSILGRPAISFDCWVRENAGAFCI